MACSSLLRPIILPVAFAVLVIASIAHGAVVEHTFNVSVRVYIYIVSSSSCDLAQARYMIFISIFYCVNKKLVVVVLVRHCTTAPL